jgi:hypothetical protein
MLHSAALPNGDIYYSSSPSTSVYRRVHGMAAAPAGCILRLPAGDSTLDPVFRVDADTVDGVIAGSITHTGSNVALMRRLRTSALPATAMTANQIIAANAWEWATIDLTGDRTVRPIEGSSLGYSASTTVRVDGRELVLEVGARFADSTAFVFDPNTRAFRRVYRAQGVPFGLVRLR